MLNEKQAILELFVEIHLSDYFLILQGLCVELSPESFKSTFFPSIGELEIDCRCKWTTGPVELPGIFIGDVILICGSRFSERTAITVLEESRALLVLLIVPRSLTYICLKDEWQNWYFPTRFPFCGFGWPGSQHTRNSHLLLFYVHIYRKQMAVT